VNLFDAWELRGEGAKKTDARHRPKTRTEPIRARRNVSVSMCDERSARSSQREADGDFMLTLLRETKAVNNFVQAISKSRETEREQPEETG